MSGRGKIKPLYPREGGMLPISLVEARSEEGWAQEPEGELELGSADSACQIFIRCSQPASNGQMQVTLEYTGDLQLASFLINHAQEIIDEQELE